jgi:hypothetical protein
LRSSDTLAHIGELSFRIRESGGKDLTIDEDKKYATVAWSEIVEEFRGTGLGKIFYKMAINDLLQRGYVVKSDSTRSPEADQFDPGLPGVWFRAPKKLYRRRK